MIGPIATAARHLIAAGVTRDALVTALADIEAALVAMLGAGVMSEFPESYQVKRSPGAIRQARYRAKLKTEAVTGDASDVTPVTGDGKASRSVTCDALGDARARTNTDSSLPSLIETPEKSVSSLPSSARGEPSPVTSRVTFDAWIAEYPRSQGMPRGLALNAWNQLSAEDQWRAWLALPGFKRWVAEQGSNYTLLSAHNFLIQRRFDGFVSNAEPPPDKRVTLQRGDPRFEAWEKHHRSIGKRIPHAANSWAFPTEWPPDHEHQQREIPLLRKIG
jgi:hypothetical protein